MIGDDGLDQVTPVSAWRALAPARHRARLSLHDLYLRYVGLGGSESADSLARHLSDGTTLDEREHDLAVLALNERFLELNASERLPYAR